MSLKDLPEADSFQSTGHGQEAFSRHVKLIACRAETALVHILREKMAREDDARALVRPIFESAVVLRPSESEKTLTIRLHQLTNAAHD